MCETRGRTSSTAASGPGVFAFRYVAPDAVGDGRDVLEFGAGSSPAATFEMTVHRGPATQLAVALEPATYVAGSGTAVVVPAQAVDAKGDVPGPASASVAVGFGTVAVSGAVTTVRVPDAFTGRTTSEVQASDGALKGQATLAVELVVPF